MSTEWYIYGVSDVDRGSVWKLFGQRRYRVRLREFVFLFVLCLLSSLPVVAQSPNGTINGLVLDPSGRVIVGAEIVIVNDTTGVQYDGKTNTEGIYVVTNLPPGPYRLQVSKIGFKTLIKPDITLNVQDALAINFTLPIGAVSETVTVEGGAPLVNTQSAAVSTVIDRNFVENLPLNGRSFNTLLQLTPGVVIAQSSPVAQGQFSIAGQRTSSNNFLVDGVSANFGGVQQNLAGTAGTGSAQAFSALGGTSSLVSVEALQEFRVETSSFAPEFGRAPGGQVILTTRSGTDDFHGGLYEYFRNNVLDANDWFAAQAGQPRAAERHNDFGGFLGGPIQRDKTFFFISYEGARLREPKTVIVPEPSEYARSLASDQVAPFIDGYPQPDDRTVTPGVYTSNFTGNFSNPATLDAGSIRIDHIFNDKFSVFGRYNEAPSQESQRTQSLSEVDTAEVGTRTVTVSATATFNPRIANSFRANYSLQNLASVSHIDSFGGAIPPSLSILAPSLADAENAILSFFVADVGIYTTGPDARNRSTQLDFGDDLAITRGTHQLKFGADYRGIYLDLRPFQSGLLYESFSTSSFVSSGQAFLVEGSIAKKASLLSRSTALYGQDMWKITPRLALTYGLRWELSPAPSPRGATTLASWENVNDPAALALAPFGTPSWRTSYSNFAPRVGVVYSLTPNGNFVLRGGWGMFYDSASDSAANLGAVFPNFASQISLFVPLPLADASSFIPSAFSTEPPYSGTVQGFAPNLKLPRSYQWNVALEKSFGRAQSASLTYVGQAGRDLLRQEGIDTPNANFSGPFDLTRNNARSNYNALQIQFRRPLSNHVQALVNYTWSHSLDNASNDTIPAVSSAVIPAGNDYASSDFDVRHSFSGALTVNIPAAGKKGPLQELTKDWSIDTVIVARSGFPFNGSILGTQIAGANPRANRVQGQPLYVHGAQCAQIFGPVSQGGNGSLLAGESCPGGKGLNPAAFAVPADGQQGTERRNDIPGFGLTEIDFSLSRKFPITERLDLQFRADAFNLFNHPNFANPEAFIGFGPSFLLSSQMLNQSIGGLDSLFQEGGPRSLQISLKLAF
jgi:Carboxypeptidase regulatory-like domain/TonB dependent receptor/TonB-dependent Receptor Plug Domain